ncbi:hypothetical protein COW36_19105 [bacterium (Candidatus Blackallbacteria) CG17_big_fil_post_rev_8_21_14_2_50_48_46]|uniref:Uncharacterized protein n=1 Tax=bacterium (Candidatus Blackallbacteria) CG17_big_fil_post_rev_8_21_14_2_50_48_46 TaxID=2014261 RepID=A0A2M7G025_9BACT|nr:MAG: hypothetical protein COW64_25365 [bacterium (Candidatus Blackallbacteria) CG18_big_fil_WC_8_21_14_2_50_49_26]PIW15033.1 MAG: hypothetical protein COW36_19105 [bacterium (Candidatus Blackallbacteria) CG17_big_fil_post_rev_8_21_14_2_50_48_46]PIW47644.1 MAG: hypothetical protein COW20_12215 [bacterium (Candidatus Blackallbacteria) CG13_big_fil_rev_8_21_14_2_50_49_14]
MKLSRAGFLRKMAAEAINVLPHFVPGLPLLNVSEPDLHREWIEIGSVAQFKPETLTEVNQKQQIVFADYKGFWALDYETYHQGGNSPRRPLRIEVNGQLSLNPQESWSEGDYLSFLTGNRITEEEV